LQGFQTLSSADAEEVMNSGSIRKWIEGGGQSVSWAEASAQLLNKGNEDNEWTVVTTLGTNMKGFLPKNWALQFSGGRVIEA
jgi:hypothetical protein